MTEFRFHPEAEIDLNEIWDFIAEDSIDAADRVRDNIFAAIQDLAQTPNQGHRRSDLTSRPLRFWRVYDYRVRIRRTPVSRHGNPAWSAQSADSCWHPARPRIGALETGHAEVHASGELIDN